jgi:hypothetical protein
LFKIHHAYTHILLLIQCTLLLNLLIIFWISVNLIKEEKLYKIWWAYPKKYMDLLPGLEALRQYLNKHPNEFEISEKILYYSFYSRRSRLWVGGLIKLEYDWTPSSSIDVNMPTKIEVALKWVSCLIYLPRLRQRRCIRRKDGHESLYAYHTRYRLKSKLSETHVVCP